MSLIPRAFYAPAVSRGGAVSGIVTSGGSRTVPVRHVRPADSPLDRVQSFWAGMTGFVRPAAAQAAARN
ncbi:MAG: hypothetical protein HRU31_02405 [Rhodobacteraceae bacterium]|nr:hypothetical protein [Paracoccaceae bacterium]